jgi:tRNA pseudouridine55 synthase
MTATDEGRMLLINKPEGWTSFDAVNKLRYTLKTKKIGHAGTLDPLASGLLILCTGKMTRQIERFMGMEKEYTGVFVLGESTPSHDRETEVTETHSITHLTEARILENAKKFTGALAQVPPAHSAVKKAGKRSYELARKGRDPGLDARMITIREFEITRVELPNVWFRIVCGKGTYIRALARDFGRELGVGAVLESLCRTRIGPYLLENAVSPHEVSA